MAGADRSRAGWQRGGMVIVQHAIGLPPFQRRCLELLQAAASGGEAPPWQPAYLLDRIRVFEGKPQVYGTQFDIDESGEMNPCPVEDAGALNALRASIGLDSIEERTCKMRAEAKIENKRSPSDRADHRSKYHEWLKRVGWRD